LTIALRVLALRRSERYGLWLLKNSQAEKSPKKLCDKKPYKRRSPLWWTFFTSQISAVLAKQEFSNSHACFQQLISTIDRGC
jgi:hypothetical protein